ncbi:facilitated trehalose transporter Tret1-like isoform X2 [Sitophilus oryzae]|nr:facilitated trehalose transporter Tret1-like isoform X2 [Sitophilus oryzae]XP_030761293.1 facilitated trehalose transporter Tret1-like isoform X2 [Sitophilus oryzae]
MFGGYQGWTAPSLVKLLSDEYPIPISQEDASIVATIGCLGHVIGGFLGSSLSDLIGRKTTIMSIGIPQIISPTLVYFSDSSKYMLYAARIVGGIGEGANIAIVGSYIAEIVVPKVRGILGGFTTIFICLGMLTVNVTGSYLTIKETSLVMALFPVIFWICFMFMPESPYYYLMKNKPEKAKESLKILRRKHDIEKEFDQLTLDVQRQMLARGGFRDLFCIPINRQVLILVTLLRFFQFYTGYMAFTAYMQLMIVQTTNLSPVFGSSLLFLAGILVMIPGLFYIDKIGRRTLFLISMVLCFAALISMAVFLTIRDYSTIDLSSVSYMPLIFVTLYNIFFCGGLGLGVNIYIAEVYPANIKASGLAIASIVYAFTVTSSTKIYQFTADYVGASVPFYIFAGTTVLGVIYIYCFVPETKGKTLGMIQNELRNRRK